jgi:TPR repeat protein
LGYSYFYGHGVKKDERKAVEWYKKAAAKNDAKALYNLGHCYADGEGVKQSNRWAKHFFTKAFEYGHRKAKGQLKKLR